MHRSLYALPLFLIAACAHPLNDTKTAANADDAKGTQAEKDLAAHYLADQAACLGDVQEALCIDLARAKYDDAWFRYRTWRTAWMVLDADLTAAGAMGALTPQITSDLAAQSALLATIKIPAVSTAAPVAKPVPSAKAVP